MDLQYFGTIVSNGRTLDAMLCKDVDRPTECMLHFWGAGAKPMAILCSSHRQEDGSDLLTPLTLFLVGEKGGIFPTQVPDADRFNFTTMRGNAISRSSRCTPMPERADFASITGMACAN